MLPYSEETYPLQRNTNLPHFIEELKTPADFFNFLFNAELINHIFIVEQSNLMSTQTNINRPAYISQNEMGQFIGKFISKTLVKVFTNL